MKDRFDDMISKEFADNLSNIHASEDLIRRTLAAIGEECEAHPAEEKSSATTLTAIDQNYIAGYVRKMSKKTHIRIAALACVAAAAAMVFAGVILMKKGYGERLNVFRSNAGTVEEQAETSSRKEVPENHSIVAMGYVIPTNNYFTARSMSNRPAPEPPQFEEEFEEDDLDVLKDLSAQR